MTDLYYIGLDVKFTNGSTETFYGYPKDLNEILWEGKTIEETELEIAKQLSRSNQRVYFELDSGPVVINLENVFYVTPSIRKYGIVQEDNE